MSDDLGGLIAIVILIGFGWVASWFLLDKDPTLHSAACVQCISCTDRHVLHPLGGKLILEDEREYAEVPCEDFPAGNLVETDEVEDGKDD